MKILIDMNLPPNWSNFFKSQNIEAAHWSEVGSPTAADSFIFEYADSNGYIVFTHDLDFGAILAATNANSPSVFQVRTQDITVENIGQKVLSCLKQFENQLFEGCLITLNEQKSKVRILPFR
jgi:predicted nuclease of predicted toxin-antitoxin system